MHVDIIKAVVLGVIEGLTEFLPVSSTGHLLLSEYFFEPDPAHKAFWDTFTILIQFGAILALLSIYFVKLWNIATGMFTDRAKMRFVIGVLLAFLPAAAIGPLAFHVIKEVLFNVWVICISLIIGGGILLWVDGLELKSRHHDATKFTLPMYFIIGVGQCFAMIPGVSRSGATIVTAMLIGADKRSAAEFSFWLAMPTMAGAFAYDLYKSHAQLIGTDETLIAIGFGVSFVAAWIVVKTFLDFVSHHGFALFAWWRVIVGSLGLIGLALGM